MITAKQIINFCEDGGTVGNVSNWNYVYKDDIIDRINNVSGFAERVLLKLLETDYSYFIVAQFNPLFNKVVSIVKSGKKLDKATLDQLKSILINDYIFILIEIVNFYGVV
jgi:hypothetical protein